MYFSHYIMHTIQHIIKCEQDIMTMMNQMFLFLTIRQLWRSIIATIPINDGYKSYTIVVDSRHRFNVININELNVFDQSEQTCHSYL